MHAGDGERPGWAYYAAILLFFAILGFAVVGVLRSSSLVGAAPSGSASPAPPPTRGPGSVSALSTGPAPTIRIPPPTASVATPPPSRTYIHPPPESEAVYSDSAADPRR